HREKYVAAGGPDGGDGGRGGSIVLRADDNMSTLMDFRYKRKYAAGNGADGQGGLRSGKDGADLVIRVPRGTLVKDKETGAVIVDMSGDEPFVLAKGGRGGLGNKHFATPTRQAPRFAKPGMAGQRREVVLELKLLADVGLVGFPNAGKSTLISRISAARPRIADYPFTTITPNLGVVRIDYERSFVVADMPGLIEGASQGQGLGHTFLKHIERTRLLAHLIDASGLSGRDPIEDYNIINKELSDFSPKVAALPQIAVLTKTDIAGNPAGEIKKELEALGKRVFEISSVTGEGIDALLGYISETLDSIPKSRPETQPVKVYKVEKEEAGYQIVKNDMNEFVVIGKHIENLVKKSDLDNEYSLRRITKQLEGTGLYDDLRQKGCRHGDTVIIHNFVFEFDENF
ncbi:MAG: GTPase ObgE, partial [Abditibacteriota bacterium]|nr:GTPase ObgE [Abditibacteriota bacterium]